MALSANTLRVKKITAGSLNVRRIHVTHGRPIPIPERLKRFIRREVRRQTRGIEEQILRLEEETAALGQEVLALRSEVSALQSVVQPIQTGLLTLQGEVQTLQAEVLALQTAIESVIAPNRDLQILLQSKVGQVVTISTPGGTVTGTVTIVGTDAVELVEATGDIVLIPFLHITAVQ